MAKLSAPNGTDGEYADAQWRVWGLSTQTHKRQGWKLHVFVGVKDHARRALNIALPILQAWNINHKFWPNDDPVLNAADTNQGKWFAIYPVSSGAALDAARAIEEALHTAAIVPLNTDLQGEIKVERGYVYTRYGPYGDAQMLSPDNTDTADARGDRPFPGWVENIWLQYSALTQPRSRIAVRLPAGWDNEFPDPPPLRRGH